MCPGKLDSLHELGFWAAGRKSIFIIGFITLFQSICILLVHYIVISSFAAKMMAVYAYNGNIDHIMTYNFPYVLLMFLVTLPFVLKKELKDIRALNIAIFLGLCLAIFFIIFNLYESDKQNISFTGNRIDMTRLFKMDENLTSVKALSILLVTFTFQQNMFPVLNRLENQAPKQIDDTL